MVDTSNTQAYYFFYGPNTFNKTQQECLDAAIDFIRRMDGIVVPYREVTKKTRREILLEERAAREFDRQTGLR